jgi:hypothetical protein
MIKEAGTSQRSLHTIKLSAGLVIAGGGLSGVCCAVTAARSGLKVIRTGPCLEEIPRVK